MPEIRIRIKPLTICIPDERLAIYERIKTALSRAEAIANDRRIDIKYRLEALRLIAYIGQVMAGVLKDAQLDEIDSRLRKLEEEAGGAGA